MKYVVLIAIVVAVGLGYYFFSPEMVLRHKADRALHEFEVAVDSQDHEKVRQVLEKYMNPKTKLRMEVRFLSILQSDDSKPLVQDFNKSDFIQFIDNILYTGTEAQYSASIEKFALSVDHTMAEIAFISNESMETSSVYAGTSVGMHYSSTTRCDGRIQFDVEPISVDVVSCSVGARLVPKQEEAVKLANPEVLQQFIKH